MVSQQAHASGGSVKNPAVAPSEDVKFRLWVRKDFAIARNLKIIDIPAKNHSQAINKVRLLMTELGVTIEDLK